MDASTTALRCGVSKAASRLGLPPADRREAWLALATVAETTADAPAWHREDGAVAAQRDQYFRAALREVFGALDPLPSKIFRIPFLGVEPAVLPEEATVLLAQPSIAVSAAHDRIICVLAQLHSLRYCPQVPNLALILLGYLSESETLGAMELLLRNNRTRPMLLLSKREETAFVKTFRTLVKSYYPQLSTHLEALGAPVRAIFSSWFRGFFTGWLPIEDVHRVVDAYLYEGPKVLIRYGLALLKINKRRLKTVASGADIDRVFRRWVARTVVKRAAAATPPVPLAIPTHLAVELAASPSDPLLPGDYGFELLRDAAFEGISGLSRATVNKLMDKYLGSQQQTQQQAHAAVVSAASSPPHAGGDGSSSSSSTTTVVHGQNAVVSLGPGSATAAAELQRLVFGSSGGGGVVAYDHLGLEPAAAAAEAAADATGAALGSWYNPKIVGLGTRLMAPDFAPPDARALTRRTRAQQRRLVAGFYRPPPPRQASEGAAYAAGGAADADETDYGAADAYRDGAVTAGLTARSGGDAGGDQSPRTVAFSARSAAVAATAGTAAAAQSARSTVSNVSALPLAGVPRDTVDEDEDDEAGGATSRSSAAWLEGIRASLGLSPTAAPSTGAAVTAGASSASSPSPPQPQPFAYSVASSPHLASLCTLLPPRVAFYNWTCLYSTDAHGWALDTLYRLCAGFAPVLVVMQAQPRGAATGGGGDAGGGGGTGALAAPSAAFTSASASRLATALSSKRPVFGFYASQGLRAPGLAASSGAAAAGAPYGGRSDFLFQLYPELNLFPVSNLEVETATSPAAAPTAAAAAAAAADGAKAAASTPPKSARSPASASFAYAGSWAATDLAGSGHRTALHRSRFLACTPELLCVGGAAPARRGGGNAGCHALRLRRDLAAAVASRALLSDMAVPLPPPPAAAGGGASSGSAGDAGDSEEVALEVLAVEAYGFVDRVGRFLEDSDAPAAARAAAKLAFLRKLGE